MLYLSHDDVLACELSPADLAAAVREAFLARARGTARPGPRFALPATDAVRFVAKGAVLGEAGFAALKWFGYASTNAARGLPDFHPVIVLNRLETGVPEAVIDGRWISAARTAAITRVAAEHLADPRSSSAGFVACGQEAHAHLDALRERFPLARVTAYSRTLRSAQALAARARERGIAAEATEDPRAAVEGHDLVVTSIPLGRGIAPFLDARWIKPGGFASMVDLGHSWSRESLQGLEVRVTDEFDPVARRSAEALNVEGELTGEMSEVVSGRIAIPPAGEGRRALIFAGSALADVAAAVAVWHRARERGLGRRLEGGP